MSIGDTISRPVAWWQLPALRQSTAFIRADGVLYAVMAVYMGTVLWLSLISGQIGNAQFFSYLSPSLRFAASLLPVWFLGSALISGIRTDPRQPLRHVLADLRWDLGPHIAAGLVLYFAVILFSGAFTTLKNLLPVFNAFAFDPLLADIDWALHFGRDPWVLLQPVFAVPLIRQGVEFLYTFAWGLEFHALTVLMAAYCTDRQLRIQYFLAYLSSWIVLGGVFAGVFLSGGPAFYHYLTGDAQRFEGLLALLATDPGRFPAALLQAYLWDNYESGRTGFGSGISAFPSLHVAIAGLCAITIWRLNRWLGVAAWLFTLLILIGSVGLGWHYAIDGYAALIGVAVLWRLAGSAAQFWARRTDAVSPALG